MSVHCASADDAKRLLAMGDAFLGMLGGPDKSLHLVVQASASYVKTLLQSFEPKDWLRCSTNLASSETFPVIEANGPAELARG